MRINTNSPKETYSNLKSLQEIPSRQSSSESRFLKSRKCKILSAITMVLLILGCGAAIAAPFTTALTANSATTESATSGTNNTIIGNTMTVANTTTVTTSTTTSTSSTTSSSATTTTTSTTTTTTTTSTTTTTTSTSSTTTTTTTATTTTTTTTSTTSITTTTSTTTTTTTTMSTTSTTTSTSTTTTTTSSTSTTTTTTTSSTTTTTAYVPSYRIITNSSDTVTAIYNATVGGASLNSTPGNGVGQYVASQGPTVCIDFSSSTCLNFGNAGQNLSAVSNLVGVGTGLYTIPIVGASIVRSVQFQAGADVPNRDPLIFTLEGSNVTGSSLSLGSVWTFLYSGVTGLAPYNVTRSAWGEIQNFTNTQPFTAYRMIVTSQRGIDYCTQFAEMHLFGIY